ARQKAEAATNELKRVRGRAEANHRVYLVAKGEAEIWKAKFSTLEAKWNELWRELEGIGWKPREAQEEARKAPERPKRRRSRRRGGTGAEAQAPEAPTADTSAAEGAAPSPEEPAAE